MKQTACFLMVAVLAAAGSAGTVRGDDSFFSRLNPLRLFRSRSGPSADQAPAAPPFGRAVGQTGNQQSGPIPGGSPQYRPMVGQPTRPGRPTQFTPQAIAPAWNRAGATPPGNGNGATPILPGPQGEMNFDAIRAEMARQGFDPQTIEQRIHQIAQHRTRGAVPIRPNQQFQLDQFRRDPNQASLDMIRAGLAQQGLDEAAIEHRMRQIQEARQTGRLQLQSSDASQITMDAFQAGMVQRGFDQAVIDERMRRIQSAQTDVAGRISNGQRPDLNALRSQLMERGIDPAAIERRVAQTAEGRRPDPARAFGRGTDPNIERLRARFQEQGLNAEDINARLARMEAARSSQPPRAATPPTPQAGQASGGGPNSFQQRVDRFQQQRDVRRR